MASSLDDMQGYEFFQNELEEAITRFLDQKADEDDIPKSSDVVRLNLFAEYISFHKNFERRDQLLNVEEILTGFSAHLSLNSIELASSSKTLIIEFIAFFIRE